VLAYLMALVDKAVSHTACASMFLTNVRQILSVNFFDYNRKKQ